jgi:membrane associated rhomboid family serine protease
MIPIHDENPTVHPPYVTVSFIAACGAIFLWQLAQGPEGQQLLVYRLGVIPAVLFGHGALAPEVHALPAFATVLTSMFLHGGWLHLIGNMLYLWIFGNNVEDSMGHTRFVIFYVLCGTLAVFAHALPNSESTIPMIGASGAISGVLGAYVLLHPHARVLVLIPLGFLLYTVRLPAFGVLSLWFAMQLVSSLFADPNSPGVAFGAHIGGFVAGLALIPFFKRQNVRLLARRR